MVILSPDNNIINLNEVRQISEVQNFMLYDDIVGYYFRLYFNGVEEDYKFVYWPNKRIHTLSKIYQFLKFQVILL